MNNIGIFVDWETLQEKNVLENNYFLQYKSSKGIGISLTTPMFNDHN